MLKTFKKVNDTHEAVFGKDNSRYPRIGGSSETKATPLIDSVSNLQHAVKKQAQVIEALLAFQGLEVDENWSELGIDYNAKFSVKKIKKSK